ncbi:MAG: PP2C family serine/threonine-protein phosphatase, partial [Planctomycetota bacterium]
MDQEDADHEGEESQRLEVEAEGRGHPVEGLGSLSGSADLDPGGEQVAERLRSRAPRAIEAKVDAGQPTDPPELARIVAAGGFVADGRVNGSLNLSRALGDAEHKQ